MMNLIFILRAHRKPVAVFKVKNVMEMPESWLYVP